MALIFENLESLKSAIAEQEHDELTAEQLRAERLALERRRQEHREHLDAERLRLLREREQRQERANRQGDAVYLLSVLITFGTLIATLLLFIIILLKY